MSGGTREGSKTKPNRASNETRPPRLWVWIAALAAAGLAAGLAALFQFRSGPGPGAARSAAPTGSTAAAVAEGAKIQAEGAARPAGLAVFQGKWLRPDGDYIIEVRSVSAGGIVEAGYYNPQPIRVSRAEALQDGELRTLFVELRDENYPGCTYRLFYDAKRDRLEGKYFQATLQETFDVVFERLR